MIEFTAEQWERVRETGRRWWAHELDRPLIQVTVDGRDPGRPQPELGNCIEAAYDLTVPAAAIVDFWDYQLSRAVFLGDAFPTVNPNLGPGCNAGFMGARPVVYPDTVWFEPQVDLAITDLRFGFDPDNVWFRRLLDIFRAALERWHGHVCVGSADLIPNLDILNTFRPGEKMLLDLYDHPDEVKRLVAESADVFWAHFDAIHDVLQPENRGYTCWTPMYSEVPYHMLQCDFSYMISPEMFDEFVKPDLAAACRRIPNSFYHLDGPGQLPHLDSILEIEELDGVQWIPGAGVPDQTHWPEVYRKIHEAGKLIQVSGSLDMLDAIADQIGTAVGICLMTWPPASERATVEEHLKRYL